MENRMSRTRSINPDELHDDVFIFKISNNPSLLKSLKRIEKPEVFSPLKEFYIDELKVCESFLFSQF